MVFKCWHIESWWIFWPINVHVIFVFVCCVLVLLLLFYYPQSLIVSFRNSSLYLHVFVCFEYVFHGVNNFGLPKLLWNGVVQSGPYHIYPVHFLFCWRITA